MKKLIVLSIFLMMSILGLVFGYENLKVIEYSDSEGRINIPLLEDNSPVVSSVMTIGKPYDDKNVRIGVNFYDSTKDNQKDSIIVIGNTFIPNRGIIYKSEKPFDVLSIYDGVVLEVFDDDLTGKYVKINHNNNLIATYKILESVKVKKGDEVKKGDLIGTSSTSEILDGNLLLLELESKSVMVNPEDYYNKTIKEI